MATEATKPTFELEGKTYLAEPTMEEFLAEAGFKSPAAQKRVQRALNKAEHEGVTSILALSKKELEDIDQISEVNAKIIFDHGLRVKLKGNLVTDFTGMVKREENLQYLPTGSSGLDEMLTYSNGSVGWRSKTMIELYGKPSMGKTQICYTTAAMVAAPENRGGWNRGVAYIDTEGAFVLDRFKYLARYWGADMDDMKDRFLYARADSMDEIEKALEDIVKQAKEKDIGIIIIDSIMDALKSQYPVGGKELSNLQPRQKHLKRVLDKMKNFAIIFNAIVLYTNHVRAEIAGQLGEPDHGAQGGAVLGHASDIRIRLTKTNKQERESYGINLKDLQQYGLKIARAEIVDCGFLPETNGCFLIGPMGIADPNNYDGILSQAKKMKKHGYISVDSQGKSLEHLDPSAKTPQEYISENQFKLYGMTQKETKTPKKSTTKKSRTKASENTE
ncbi:MAG: AAA family ATPase [Candidatus Kariarchaeaceae archaeon]|jgi:RecA/RadA recombinase